MRELSAANAAEYLRETGRVPAGAKVAVWELPGGVSNVVLRVEVAGQAPFVLKQSRERLRVAMEWRSRLDRIWTERAALEVLGTLLPAGTVPAVLFEDRDNYLFAMECAPADAETWKARLLSGRVELDRARATGTALGAIHAGAAGHPSLTGVLADTSLFDSLRVDPYYRTVARFHPDLADTIGTLIDTMAATPDTTLVLGDFSPKNILVHARGIVLLDFECAHAGDPAFDLGFFISHLVLKAFRGRRLWGDPAPYLAALEAWWAAYAVRAGIDPAGERARRGMRHAAACLLARLDGKSPVDYLQDLDTNTVRRFARELLQSDSTPRDLLRSGI